MTQTIIGRPQSTTVHLENIQDTSGKNSKKKKLKKKSKSAVQRNCNQSSALPSATTHRRLRLRPRVRLDGGYGSVPDENERQLQGPENAAIPRQLNHVTVSQLPAHTPAQPPLPPLDGCPGVLKSDVGSTEREERGQRYGGGTDGERGRERKRRGQGDDRKGRGTANTQREGERCREGYLAAGREIQVSIGRPTAPLKLN